MSEEPVEHPQETPQTEVENVPHRFMIMIVGSIVVALLLVAVSLQMYYNNGTALLDLSRPSLKSLRDQIKPDEKFDSFPASGPISVKTLDDFKQSYERHAHDLTSVDAFGTDVLSDQALGIDAPVE